MSTVVCQVGVSLANHFLGGVGLVDFSQVGDSNAPQFLGSVRSVDFCQVVPLDVVFSLEGVESVDFCQVGVSDVVCSLGGAESDDIWTVGLWTGVTGFWGGAETVGFCRVDVADVAHFSEGVGYLDLEYVSHLSCLLGVLAFSDVILHVAFFLEVLVSAEIQGLPSATTVAYLFLAEIALASCRSTKWLGFQPTRAIRLVLVHTTKMASFFDFSWLNSL